jgi:hypothetical protein
MEMEKMINEFQQALAGYQGEFKRFGASLYFEGENVDGKRFAISCTPNAPYICIGAQVGDMGFGNQFKDEKEAKKAIQEAIGFCKPKERGYEQLKLW